MATANTGTNNSVRVEIYDQAYNLRGSDAEYILKLAEYVDTKMRLVSQQTSTVDSLRVAVLAALVIGFLAVTAFAGFLIFRWIWHAIAT